MVYSKVTSAGGVVTYHRGAVVPAGGVAITHAEHDAAYSVSTSSARPVSLASYVRTASLRVLATAQAFNVAPLGTAAVSVLADATDTTMVDLGDWWRFGAVNSTASRTWTDVKGVATVLTGGQCVTLATAVGNWRAEVKLFLAQVEAEIASGTITTPTQVDALAWPKGA